MSIQNIPKRPNTSKASTASRADKGSILRASPGCSESLDVSPGQPSLENTFGRLPCLIEHHYDSALLATGFNLCGVWYAKEV
uniref:Uncharacterized protein n=1 Tax=Steinernema glaseri TaxID=37863 RepID=A0A1I7Z3Q3_9BILA